jgi:hypothetical protein
MKTDKPERIQINALLDLSGKGGFTTISTYIINACKQLDPKDYLTFDGFYCYPVKTLRDILSTYAKDSKIHVHPVVGWMRNGEFSAGNHYTKDAGDFTATYNTIAIREHGTPSIQRLYPTRREDITTHVAELTTEDITETPVKDPWIARAISKDDAQPQLMIHGGNFAADGYRLHYNAALPELDYCEVRASSIKTILTPAREYPNQVTLNAAAVKELITACKLAKKGKHIFRISVNGTMELSTTSEEYGNWSASISKGYNHTGEDVTLAINPGYLMDALDKPRGVTMRMIDGKHPVYITDGTRESVIMTMQLDK